MNKKDITLFIWRGTVLDWTELGGFVLPSRLNLHKLWDVFIHYFLLLGVLLGGPSLAHADIWNVESRLSLQSESFVSSDYASTPKKSYLFMGASMVSYPDDPLDTPVHVDVRGLFSPDSPVLSTFNVSELYFVQDNFSIGRKRMTWSQGDEDWNLGLMQPQYRWNVLRPQSQGLAGAFLHFGKGTGQGWSLNLFGSPIFLPDQGAGYVLTEGRFEKVSPWFQTLPREVRLSGSDRSRILDYQVEIPQIEKIIFNAGYAAQLSYDREGEPYRLAVGVAYKPMNTLSMGIDGWALAGPRAPVVIEPTVSYHRLATSDLEVRGGPLEWRLGMAFEASDDPREQRDDLTYAHYEPMLVTTTSVGYVTPKLATRLLLIHRNGGKLSTTGPKAEDLMDVFPERLPYKDAAAIDARFRAYQSGAQSLDIATRWTEGISESYSRWTLDATYKFSNSWSVWADIVFVRAEKRPGSDPDLFADFENHDSVRTGVSYAF